MAWVPAASTAQGLLSTLAQPTPRLQMLHGDARPVQRPISTSSYLKPPPFTSSYLSMNLSATKPAGAPPQGPAAMAAPPPALPDLGGLSVEDCSALLSELLVKSFGNSAAQEVRACWAC